MADSGSAGAGGDAAQLTEAVAGAIADVGAGGSASPRPISVADRSGAAVSTVSFEFVVGEDGRIYGAGDDDAIPDGPKQTIDVELIKSAFGWIAMAQVRGPRRTECVGWSGAKEGRGAAASLDDILDALPGGDDDGKGEVEEVAEELSSGGSGGGGGLGASDAVGAGDTGDQLGSLLSGDPRSATGQALAMLQGKGCLASAQTPVAPVPTEEDAGTKKWRAGSLVGLLVLLLGGLIAIVLAVALAPDTSDDEASPTTTVTSDGGDRTTTTTGATTTTGVTSTTAPGGDTTSTTGNPGDPGDPPGGPTSPPACHEFAVAFTWMLKPPPYPVSGPTNPFAGQEAVAELFGSGLPSTATTIVDSDGTVTFGPFFVGDGPWNASLISVGGQSVPTAGAPAVLSSDNC